METEKRKTMENPNYLHQSQMQSKIHRYQIMAEMVRELDISTKQECQGSSGRVTQGTKHYTCHKCCPACLSLDIGDPQQEDISKNELKLGRLETKGKGKEVQIKVRLPQKRINLSISYKCTKQCLSRIQRWVEEFSLVQPWLKMAKREYKNEKKSDGHGLTTKIF